MRAIGLCSSRTGFRGRCRVRLPTEGLDCTRPRPADHSCDGSAGDRRARSRRAAGALASSPSPASRTRRAAPRQSLLTERTTPAEAPLAPPHAPRPLVLHARRQQRPRTRLPRSRSTSHSARSNPGGDALRRSRTSPSSTTRASITSAPVSRRRSSASRFVVAGRPVEQPGGAEQQRAGADRGDRDAVGVEPRERRGDRAALDLARARRSGCRRCSAAAGHDHEVRTLGERPLGERASCRAPETTRSAPSSVHERDVERRAGAARRGAAARSGRARRGRRSRRR